MIDRNTIVPISSEVERATLKRAFADVAGAEFHGAHSHLREAANALTAGNYADSIRESIHAVESVARTLDSTASTLAPALSRLEKTVGLHGALRAGFVNLYGFTSDEDGIRHALLDKGASDVDETDALYMLGACAAFVSYLIARGRKVGLFQEQQDR